MEVDYQRWFTVVVRGLDGECYAERCQLRRWTRIHVILQKKVLRRFVLVEVNRRLVCDSKQYALQEDYDEVEEA